MRAAATAVLAILAACGAGGTYAKSERSNAGEVDRGETNGRMFDFVSNLPEGDDWQIRIRDNSLWAAYASGADNKELGTVELTAKETKKIWNLIDDLDLSGRKKGKKDEDEGYVMLRLREPGGDEGHEITTVYLTRATEDEQVLALGEYLQIIIKKHFKKDVQF